VSLVAVFSHNGWSFPRQSLRHWINKHSQAHRIITQVVFSGARIIGRAVTESYRQAAASQKFAAANAGSGGGSAFSSSNITMDEACKILNVGPGKGGIIEEEAVSERFKRLFDLNDPQKGGSFYLQSKILRARERIERELVGQQRMSEREAELRDGFKPKFTKDDK
jgi:import inner membrane translocase subunit TIM16